MPVRIPQTRIVSSPRESPFGLNRQISTTSILATSRARFLLVSKVERRRTKSRSCSSTHQMPSLRKRFIALPPRFILYQSGADRGNGMWQEMVPPGWIEHPTSPLPRTNSRHFTRLRTTRLTPTTTIRHTCCGAIPILHTDNSRRGTGGDRRAEKGQSAVDGGSDPQALARHDGSWPARGRRDALRSGLSSVFPPAA